MEKKIEQNKKKNNNTGMSTECYRINIGYE